MNNIIYLKKDPILTELDNSVDKNSAKKMIAFKYFNNNLEQLNNYLENTKHNSGNKLEQKFILIR